MSSGYRRTVIVLAGLIVAAAVPAAIGLSDPRPAERSVPAGDAATAALWTGLDQIMQRPAQSDNWSVLAVSLARGDTLYAHNPHESLVPASNIKLFTSAVALVHMGPHYRFSTYLMVDGPVRDGVLEGNLYLYGTGDPTLGTRFAPAPAPTLLAFADSIAALGIREIRGNIIGDGSYFSGSGSGAGWQPDYLNAWYAAPGGALSVHENLVRINVSPGTPGAPPELRFAPGGEVPVHNEAVTGGAGRIDVRRIDYEGPIVVRGRVASGTSSHAVPVNHPALYAATLLRDVLASRDIVVHGQIVAIADESRSAVTGRAVFAPAFDNERPSLRVIATRRSAPLHEILQVINHQSHNFYAEQVLRTVGRVAGGDGSAASGERAIKQVLAQAGVDTAFVRIVDGSGLSPLNSASASAFIGVLTYMARSPHAEAFQETLPVAGEVQRFRRMGGTPAQGNLRAKTGTIERVSALSGYVTSANGELIAFSIIGNDLRSVANGKYIENMIGAQLAGFDRRTVSGAGAVGARR